MKCIQPNQNDYNNLLKFADRVFHIDFLKIQPKLYNDVDECLSIHGVCKENDKIIGCICTNPSKFIIKDEALTAIGIGSVAVHKKHRGKGIMRALMEFSDEKALSLGVDIGFLSGARGRYERYGYVPCGIDYLFEISGYNISHFKPLECYSFENINNSGKILEDIIRIYENEPNRWERKESKFSDILHTGGSLTFAVKNENNKVCGFITANRNFNEISDIYLTDDSLAADVLLCFAKEKRKSALTVHLYDFQRELIKNLSLFAEYYSVSTSMSIKIFNFKSTIEKMLKYKLLFSNLAEGELRLKIDGEIYLISVKGNNASVEITDREFDLAMTETEATSALCTYHGGLYENALMSAWSPICPISMSHTDNV